jgi:hypothetical protein
VELLQFLKERLYKTKFIAIENTKEEIQMGYTTDFTGSFDVTPVLEPEHREYLSKFAETRRMKRDSVKAKEMKDEVREAVGLPIGEDGGYFVGAGGHAGQNNDDSIENYNSPPHNQPGLWCQWTPNEDGDAIEWDCGEKFYNYVEWLDYIVEHFLKPWGYTLNGEVEWQGEDSYDLGKIVVTDNEIDVKTGRIVYE